MALNQDDAVAPLRGEVMPFLAHDADEELPECPVCGRLVFVVDDMAVVRGEPLECCKGGTP